MNYILDLREGITETEQYKAWKFPGGEVHVKLKPEAMEGMEQTVSTDAIQVMTRLNSSDDIIFLGLVLDIIHKEFDNYVIVMIPYFPYQQADRDFAEDESFSLSTVARMISTFRFDCVYVYDPHSDVTPALLTVNKVVKVTTNAEYIKFVLEHLPENTVILSPDAGAYKKIFKLAKEIDFKGRIECANKYRPNDGGEPEIRLSFDDLGGADVLIVDDICVGGRTFIELAKILKDKGVGDLHLAVSHGVFSNGFEELSKHFSTLYCTNSIKDEYDCDFLTVYELYVNE